MSRMIVGAIYAGAVVVVAVGIDVTAKVQAWARQPSEPAAVLRAAIMATPPPEARQAPVAAPAPAVPSLPELLTSPAVTRASRGSCERLLDLRERNAVELALMLAPKKDKKTRQRVTRETRAKISAYQPETLAACAELPQAEVDCVLAAQDLAEQHACGAEVNRVLSE